MRRLKRATLIVAAIALFAVGYRVLGVYEFREGDCSAKPVARFSSTYPKRLVVMTFNIEGHASLLRANHIEEIADTINRYQPDVVGINEAHRNTWQSRFHDHTQELSRRTGMNVVFGRSYRFAGGDFGNAVLTRGQILASETHELPGTGEPRTLLDTKVRVNGGVVEFYTTHLAAWGSLGETARNLQLQCISDHLAASAHPFILTGDLNAPPDSPEVAKFLAGTVMQLAGDPQTPTHRVMERRLDYIIVDRGWTVRSARVLDDGPSDHRPVIAELNHP